MFAPAKYLSNRQLKDHGIDFSPLLFAFIGRVEMDKSTPDDRIELALDQFGNALAALVDAVETDTGDKKSRDSILLSFVFTFEMAWRSLKAVLAVRGLNTPDYAAAVLRAAFQARLISEPQLWSDIREARNNISHAYDEGRAIVLADYVRSHVLAAFKQLTISLHSHED
jgi:nucleotidyltransferase substrate binding protein (TIGR01987 family)